MAYVQAADCESADVIVIGGGPAGSAAALHLARRNLQVIQLERRVFGDPSNDAWRSGEALLPRTRRELAALDLDMHAPSWELARVDRIRMRWPDGTRTDDQLGNHGICMVDRERFDQHLFLGARAAGVDGRQGWRARGLRHDGRGRIQGVYASGPDGAQHELRAPMVVDAGGRHALALRELDLRIVEQDGDFFAMAMYFDSCAGLRPGDWELHLFDRQALTVAHLTQLGPHIVRCAMGTTMRLKRAAERCPQAFFWQRLRQAPGLLQRLQGSTLLQRPWVRGGVGYGVRKVVFDGLVLIGDAMGYSNPLFGDGVCRAMRTARLAASAVAAALQRGECSRRALAQYARRHAAASCIDWCERRLVRAMYRHIATLETLGRRHLVRRAALGGLMSP